MTARFQTFQATEPGSGIPGHVVRDTETGKDYGFATVVFALAGESIEDQLPRIAADIASNPRFYRAEDQPVQPTSPIVDIILPEETA